VTIAAREVQHLFTWIVSNSGLYLVGQKIVSVVGFVVLFRTSRPMDASESISGPDREIEDIMSATTSSLKRPKTSTKTLGNTEGSGELKRE
jgi:hypothetical protein